MDNDIDEPYELVPGTVYKKWWCQECGSTLYEKLQDQTMPTDPPPITGWSNVRWVSHNMDWHKILGISIFKHRHMVIPIPRKK